MPKNPLKGFVRRRSSGNLLDLQQHEESAQPAVGSFRVLERPAGATTRRTSAQRPLSAMPFGQFKSNKSTDDLRHLGTSVANRGSAITTNSGSSGYYDTSSSSARYSSSSTLPSSVDHEHEEAQDELFPVKVLKQTPQKDAIPQAQASAGAANPSLSSRATKAMGFGFGAKKKQDNSATTPQPRVAAPISALPEHVAAQDRATTISSYASTAVPPRLDGDLGNADYFSTDFGNMFEGLGQAKPEMPLPPPPNAQGDHMRSDSEPPVPTRSPFRPTVIPSPEPQLQHHARPVEIATSSKRYSWQSRSSTDELMSSSFEANMASPKSSEFSEDTVKVPAFSRFRPGYQAVPLRQDSPGFEADSQPGTSGFHPQQVLRGVGNSDDNGSLQQDSYSAGARSPPQAARSGQSSTCGPFPVPADAVAQHTAIAVSRVKRATNGITEPAPQDGQLRPHISGDDPLFDVSPGSPAYLAAHNAFEAREVVKPQSPPKRMTRAQFEMQQSARDDSHSEHSDNESDDGYDDGDDEERQAELIRQRRKQEANLAVYRQQMMKASGGRPADLGHTQRPIIGGRPKSAPLLERAADRVSTPEEEDDDVPLGILQAHGFPNKNRPPMRTDTGSAPPGMGGALPPFARRLPQMPPDPYYGAGIVSSAQREGLGFGAQRGSALYGGITPGAQPMHPGGLVGVIAGEEQAKAMRRPSASPVTGGYGPIPLPNSMMPRSSSMMSMGGMAPSMSPLGMPNSIESQAQMLQMMQLQQQMMHSIIQMQSGQPLNSDFRPSPSMQSLGSASFNPTPAQRSTSGYINSTSNVHANNAGRLMTMVQPPPQWGNNAANARSSTMTGTARPFGYAGSVYNYNLSSPAPGYTPSIAPSERSNVGMPSRYRPVSIVEASGRTQNMGSNIDAVGQHASRPTSLAVPRALANSTIRNIDKPKVTSHAQPPARSSIEDDDDDEGWAQLRAKREARKTRRFTDMAKENEPPLNELYTPVD